MTISSLLIAKAPAVFPGTTIIKGVFVTFTASLQTGLCLLPFPPRIGLQALPPKTLDFAFGNTVGAVSANDWIASAFGYLDLAEDSHFLAFLFFV